MVGTHNFGYRHFWETTFNKIGIKLTDQFMMFLQRIEMNKKRKNERKCNIDVKRRRKHRQEAVEKKLLDESRTVDYKAGIGLDIGFKEDGKPKAKVCKWCGSITHKTKRSKQCPFNVQNVIREIQQSGEVKEVKDVTEESELSHV